MVFVFKLSCYLKVMNQRCKRCFCSVVFIKTIVEWGALFFACINVVLVLLLIPKQGKRIFLSLLLFR